MQNNLNHPKFCVHKENYENTWKGAIPKRYLMILSIIFTISCKFNDNRDTHENSNINTLEIKREQSGPWLNKSLIIMPYIFSSYPNNEFQQSPNLNSDKLDKNIWIKTSCQDPNAVTQADNILQVDTVITFLCGGESAGKYISPEEFWQERFQYMDRNLSLPNHLSSYLKDRSINICTKVSTIRKMCKSLDNYYGIKNFSEKIYTVDDLYKIVSQETINLLDYILEGFDKDIERDDEIIKNEMLRQKFSDYIDRQIAEIENLLNSWQLRKIEGIDPTQEVNAEFNIRDGDKKILTVGEIFENSKSKLNLILTEAAIALQTEKEVVSDIIGGQFTKERKNLAYEYKRKQAICLVEWRKRQFRQILQLIETGYSSLDINKIPNKIKAELFSYKADKESQATSNCSIKILKLYGKMLEYGKQSTYSNIKQQIHSLIVERFGDDDDVEIFSTKTYKSKDKNDIKYLNYILQYGPDRAGVAYAALLRILKSDEIFRSIVKSHYQ
ncbi:MAG: hypothetical protein R3B45_03555 [Bdellovibrionota bacterium]